MTEHPHPPIGRRIVKTGWRISRDSILRRITDVDELIKRTRRLANLCYLDARQHRKACELALEMGESNLARWLTEMDSRGPLDTD